MSESLRIRYPFPHYLILCQEASEGLWEAGGGGEVGTGDSREFLAGIKGCADTHMISQPDKNTSLSLSCGVWRSAQTGLATV